MRETTRETGKEEEDKATQNGKRSKKAADIGSGRYEE